MSKQTDYTPEEWKTISGAPMLAGMLVSISDMSGPIGMMKEAFAVVREVTGSHETTPSELIAAIGEGIKAQGGRPETPELSGDAAAFRAKLIESCKQAAAIVSQKSPGEATEYKRWLVSLARKTAEASKEGGFLGFGGTLVTEEETAAVNALANALGVSA